MTYFFQVRPHTLVKNFQIVFKLNSLAFVRGKETQPTKQMITQKGTRASENSTLHFLRKS